MGLIEKEKSKPVEKTKILCELVINQKIYDVPLPFIPKPDDIIETNKARLKVKKVTYVERENSFVPRVYLIKELTV
jgi:hypothetical protein